MKNIVSTKKSLSKKFRPPRERIDVHYIKLFILSIFLFSCSIPVRVNYYPPIPKRPDKTWVDRRLKEMRDSHIRNRGAHNSPEFDDYCVDVYNAIIEWLKNGKQ